MGQLSCSSAGGLGSSTVPAGVSCSLQPEEIPRGWKVASVALKYMNEEKNEMQSLFGNPQPYPDTEAEPTESTFEKAVEEIKCE